MSSVKCGECGATIYTVDDAFKLSERNREQQTEIESLRAEVSALDAVNRLQHERIHTLRAALQCSGTEVDYEYRPLSVDGGQRTKRKFWMIDPQLFNADKDGRAYVPVELEPREHYDYENDPEYIQIEVEALPVEEGQKGSSDD